MVASQAEGGRATRRGPYRLVVGIKITRRLAVHVVTDPEEKERFVSKSITECLDWLAENEIYLAEVEAGERRWLIELSPLPR